jgi:hypothetical protein
VHPVHDEPTQHISFNRYTIFGMTDKGRCTIDKEGGLDLNRRELINNRKRLWDDIHKLTNTMLLLRQAELEGRVLPDAIRQNALDIEQRLKEKCRPTEPFSAMVSIEVERLYTLFQDEPNQHAKSLKTNTPSL